MKQTVRHGASIDTATPEEVAAIVARALDERTSEDYTRRPGVINLSAAGAGTATEDISPQFDWRMERVSIGGAGAVNALVQLFENDANSAGNLLEVIQLGAAGLYSDGFANTLYVPANSVVIVSVTGGVANGQVNYRLQIKQVKAVGAVR